MTRAGASPTTELLFVGVVAVVALAVLSALRRAGLGATAKVALVLVYLAVPAALADAGALDRYAPLPAPALVLALALMAVTVGLTLSPIGARLALRVPLAGLVGLQAFRIAVELLLHRLWVEGVIPREMTYAGRNLDVVTGITGLALGAWLWSRRRVPRGAVLAWSVIGLALLANIVAVAILSTPVPFRRFTEGPPNLLPSTFPWVWLPSFLVQVALGSHVLVFRQLTLAAGRDASRR